MKHNPNQLDVHVVKKECVARWGKDPDSIQPNRMHILDFNAVFIHCSCGAKE